MSDGWKFHRDDDGDWRWTYVMQGRTVAQARRGHKAYSECVSEARVHGYREQVSAGARHTRELRAKGKKR